MQLAKNAQGVWISADRANKKELYFCPKCQGLVRLRSGEGVRPHFAHVIETKARGESQEHRAAKVWLAEQLGRLGLQVEAEVPLPFDQRPDLLTQVGQDKLAVEFQKSRLSAKALKQRIAGYRKEGYKQWWIQNTRALLPYLNREDLVQYVHYHPRLGCYQWIWDQATEELILQYDLHIDWRRARQVVGSSLSLRQATGLAGLIQGDFPQMEPLQKERAAFLEHEGAKWRKARQMKKRYERYFRRSHRLLDQRLANYLYQKGKTISDVPLVCFWPPLYHLFSSTPLLYGRYLLLEGEDPEPFLKEASYFHLPFIKYPKGHIQAALMGWGKSFI